MGRGVKRLWVVEERNFHRLLLAICTETIDMIYRIYNAVYTALRRLFSGSKWMTLNGLNAHLAEMKSSYGAHQKNLNEDRHKLSAAKCSSMSLLSYNIRFVGIFAGVT